MKKIKVGIIGVGNCASSLVQGVEHYKKIKYEKDCIGLKNLFLGKYHPKHIEFVCAFDITENKVGRDVSEAIFKFPNNTIKFSDVPNLRVKVTKGKLLDTPSSYLQKSIKFSKVQETAIEKTIKQSGAEILLNLLPSNFPKSTNYYAEKALNTGCSFINATPNILAIEKKWINKFIEANLPLVGDDLTDQIGATFLHKVLLETINNRGVKLEETYQLDVGGGSESANTIERAWRNKREIKTNSIKSVLPYDIPLIAGSTDFVEFLENRRESYFWIKGKCFGSIPISIDLKLNTMDAPNSGSILFDVIRAVKIALDRGEKGYIHPISTYAFKKTVKNLPLLEAERIFNKYIR